MRKDISLTVEYLDYHDKYIKKFGKDKTVVLMQVGTFYEAYATLDRGPDLKILEELTEAAIAHKGKETDKFDIKNPFMWGFPIVAKEKFIGILIDNGYHLIIIDQVTPPPKPKREVTAILSPATYLESVYKPTSNFVANISIEEIIQHTGQPLACIGMSAIDVSTGEVYVHESYSQMDDDKLGLDETIRFLNGLMPKEVLIHTENLTKLNEKFITEYLDLDGKIYQFKNFNPEHAKVAFQRKTLELIYPNSNGLSSIFDSLGLTRHIYTRKSLVTLLIYISDHYIELVNGIIEPRFYISETNLTLGNDAINQLFVVKDSKFDNNTRKIDTKFHCLMDVINKATTSMGKRYVKIKLVSPYTSLTVLNKTYDVVETMIKNNFYIKVEESLKNIYDIERLERKLSLLMLHPMQMVELVKSYGNVLKLFSTIKSNNKLTSHIKTAFLRKSIKKLNKKLSENINTDKAKLYNLGGIEENIFNEGIYPKLDAMQAKIGLSKDAMEVLLDKLDDMIEDPRAKGKTVTLKHNKVDGYYFELTKNRYEMLKAEFEEVKSIQVGGHCITFDNFNTKETKNNIKLMLPMLKAQTTDIDKLRLKIMNITFDKYTQFMRDIYNTFRDTFKKSTQIVTILDYYCTIAKVAKMYNYIKPTIADQQDGRGYIVANDLRHPIVERIIDHEYIPHNVDIGRDLKGMLIYGLNASGKSVLMKAIGLCIIMAQAGFYVPAKIFTYYPYKSVYTRITGNDDMIRGLSSFTLEMVEVNSILRRADQSTLVIGDEVCRGTEHISGNSLVAATLLHLSDIGSTFVFATHLHELMDLDEIKEKTNIKAFHLSVANDPETDELIYDRELKPGPGERIYGIIVAKHIIKNPKFINKALEIKNILLDRDPYSSSISTKKSKHNPQLLMDRCDFCGKKNTHKNPTPLETHHINQQKDCENGFVKSKPHIKKNHISNLTKPCQECHDDIHRGDIDIKGIYVTSKGKKIITNKSKIK